MRIIGGLYRGKKLKPPLDSLTRPTSDRVKENIFNILSNLMDFQGTQVLDLFCGSGALGIEALSRGSTQITFVENHPSALKILKENTKSFQTHCSIFKEDVVRFLSQQSSLSYDLILMDPPYKKVSIEALLENIKKNQWLKEDGLIVTETSNDETITSGHLTIKSHRTYGKTSLWFLGT